MFSSPGSCLRVTPRVAEPPVRIRLRPRRLRLRARLRPAHVLVAVPAVAGLQVTLVTRPAPAVDGGAVSVARGVSGAGDRRVPKVDLVRFLAATMLGFLSIAIRVNNPVVFFCYLKDLFLQSVLKLVRHKYQTKKITYL